MKVKYILDEKRFTYIECETEDEVNAIKDANRQMEAFIKSEKRYGAKTSSYDHCIDKDDVEQTYEPADESEDILSKLIKKEKITAIYDALNHITPRQKDIFIKHTMHEISFRQLGRDLNIDHKTASREYDIALDFIRNFVKYLF